MSSLHPVCLKCCHNYNMNSYGQRSPWWHHSDFWLTNSNQFVLEPKRFWYPEPGCSSLRPPLPVLSQKGHRPPFITSILQRSFLHTHPSSLIFSFCFSRQRHFFFTLLSLRVLLLILRLWQPHPFIIGPAWGRHNGRIVCVCLQYLF